MLRSAAISLFSSDDATHTSLPQVYCSPSLFPPQACSPLSLSRCWSLLPPPSLCRRNEKTGKSGSNKKSSRIVQLE
jgi:hypothetical protein